MNVCAISLTLNADVLIKFRKILTKSIKNILIQHITPETLFSRNVDS